VYYVYILRCEDESLYTGITTDVKRRFREHVEGVGAAYTRSHKPKAMVYIEEVGTRGDALRREIEIKKMAKEEKERLCGE
jgi:putative endonuclease